MVTLETQPAHGTGHWPKEQTANQRPMLNRLGNGLWRAIWRNRHTHPQSAAKGRIEQLDGARVQIGGALHDGQPQPVAIAARGRFPVKTREHGMSPLGRYARSVVDDLK